MSEYLCIYHGNCADGFGAAWAVKEALGDSVEFHAGAYQRPPPNVNGKKVILVDFSYPPETLMAMIEDAYSILVIDHHKSAMEAMEKHEWPSWLTTDMSKYTGPVDFTRYQQNLYQDECENCGSRIYFYFDMDRSGAMMAWDFFHPEKDAPPLIGHIQDRDLWKFELEGTRQIQAALFSYPYDFDIWDSLMHKPEALKLEGYAIERKHFKDIHEFIGVAASTHNIGGHIVPTLNAPYFWSSDAGHIMSKGHPFAACYWHTDTGMTFSLRSDDDGLDVSEIALKFGGGGHKNAAGFSIDHHNILCLAE